MVWEAIRANARIWREVWDGCAQAQGYWETSGVVPKHWWLKHKTMEELEESPSTVRGIGLRARGLTEAGI